MSLEKKFISKTATRKPSKASVLTATVKVRKLLSKKSTWIQGDDAQDSKGYSVSPRGNQSAVKFCISGAFNHVTKSDAIVQAGLANVARQLPNFSQNEQELADAAIGFNDAFITTHKNVIKALDESIKSLRKQ